ncbi:phosphomethylpyrimidine synthase ThiC [bacterium]|nr:phosphomethylpyrimidine synthase ThiC [bacterium]
MTQLEFARAGKTTAEMSMVAAVEGFTGEEIRKFIADGTVVIPKNINHKNIKPIGIGEPLKTKVNANIGTSQGYPDPEREFEKLEVLLEAGADAVMDLSTGGDLSYIREKLIEKTNRPIGTVPIYESMVHYKADFQIEKFFDILTAQAKQGVDFFTIHSGVKLEHIPYINKRLMGVVSRGGAYLVSYMKRTKQENPLYVHYDKILDICRQYDVTLSLGDGLRPGCIDDATDEAQLAELKVLGTLAQRAREKGVQVMIEGPGHIPLHQIKENMELKKKYAGSTPFYVLGPLVTDIAPGYDHICGAVGATIAAFYGASFLCYVTPREHLGLPDKQDVKDGVIASRIAAHAADLALNKHGARQWDTLMSKARVEFDWEREFELSIDPKKTREKKDDCNGADKKVCSMCGDYCSMKITQEQV